MKLLSQHLRTTLGWGLFLTAPCFLTAPVAQAGIPVTDLTTVTVPATPSTYVEGGITYNFGLGLDVNVASFGIDLDGDGTDEVFAPGSVADRIFVRRVEAGNAAGVVGDRIRFQYDGQFVGGNTVNIQGSQLFSVEDVLGSLSVNRGTDNLFLNNGPVGNNRANNIERVDLVFLSGITAPANPALLDDLGFVFNERLGNNSYQIAAITAIDGAGNPTAFGPLVFAPVADYGPPLFVPPLPRVWQILESEENSTVPNNPTRFGQAGGQGFEGQFHSFQELGVAAGQTIFGYALFGRDVQDPSGTGADLVDFTNATNFPRDTTDNPGGFQDTGDHFGGGGSTFVNIAAFDPSLGVAKNAVSVVGTQVTYDFVIENFSLVTVDNLSLIDDFDTTFGAGNYTVVTSPAVQVAPTNAISNVAVAGTFTGSGANTEMLDTAVSQLAAGDSVTIRLTVEIATPLPDPPGPLEAGEYENTATTGGTGPTGTRVTDDSVDGADPDLDGDGDPTNDTSPTLVSLGDPNLIVVKRITSLIRSTGTTNFTSFVDDPADADDDVINAAGLTPTGLPSVDASNPSDSGDIVEYTIYFLSNGLSTATDTQICDLIPTGTTFVQNAYGAGQGIEVQLAGTTTPDTQTNVSDADNSTFFATLAPLPTGNPCPDPSNPNGAVIVDLGDVPTTAGSNGGFIRFQVQLN